MQLIVDTLPLSHGIIGSSIDESWPRPVPPGDTLHLRCQIITVTPSELASVTQHRAVADDDAQPEGPPVQTMSSRCALRFARPEQHLDANAGPIHPRNLMQLRMSIEARYAHATTSTITAHEIAQEETIDFPVRRLATAIVQPPLLVAGVSGTRRRRAGPRRHRGKKPVDLV